MATGKLQVCGTTVDISYIDREQAAIDGLSADEAEYLAKWRQWRKLDPVTILGKPSFGDGDSAPAPVLSCPFCRSCGQIESRFHPGTCCNCGGRLGEDAPEIDEDLAGMRAAFVEVTDAMDNCVKTTTGLARSWKDAGIGFYGASSVTSG